MSSAPSVRPALLEEHLRLRDVLVVAFHDDPLARWLFPDPAERDLRHAELFAGPLENRDPSHQVDTVEGATAVAIWRRVTDPPSPDAPPGASPDAKRLFADLAAAAPAPPYETLVLLGARGRGTRAGGALLRHGLASRLGRVALWTANPVNLPFYGRAGLDVQGEATFGAGRAWWLVRSSAAA